MEGQPGNHRRGTTLENVVSSAGGGTPSPYLTKEDADGMYHNILLDFNGIFVGICEKLTCRERFTYKCAIDDVNYLTGERTPILTEYREHVTQPTGFFGVIGVTSAGHRQFFNQLVKDEEAFLARIKDYLDNAVGKLAYAVVYECVQNKVLRSPGHLLHAQPPDVIKHRASGAGESVPIRIVRRKISRHHVSRFHDDRD